MRKAVVFGAGSVGRGFLGQLLCDGGWSVTFLDVDPVVVAALATDHCYPHLTLSEDASVRTVVGPVTAVDVRDTPTAVRALCEADLVATCVGAGALPAVADILAEAVVRRIDARRPPFNVLLAENVHGCATVVRDLLTERLPDHAAALDTQLGLLETSIGRMIPAADATQSEPTLVRAEPYRILPYDAAAAVGEPLEIPGLVADLSVPFSFYGDRKLYVHNLGHCFAACLGVLLGDTKVWQSVERAEVRYLVRAAMLESAIGLASSYGVSLPPLAEHVDDLLHRFGNRALDDTTARVSRDLERKLAPDDRLFGAFRLARGQGLAARHLSLAIAAAALVLERRDGQSADGVAQVLERGAGGFLDGEARALLAEQRMAFADRADLSEQLRLIDHAFEPARVV
jgi:mannitol-1-phosphate 5-dehydrogenase